MNFVQKLKDTLSTVSSSVSSVLPGNPVTREYEPVQHVASAGPGLMWKIYSGYKRSTKQEVSIWVFEKSYLENNWKKSDRERMLEALKFGVSRLTRLRHPRLLTVEHPIEESRESLAFAAEPVFCSVANALGRVDNMPPCIPPELSDFSFHDIDIRHGFQQLSEALAFLHNDAKILHRNVCPGSVVVNKVGCWKLAGFDFCTEGVANTSAPATNYQFVEWCSDVHPFAQPQLDYLAPEYVVGGRVDGSSDMFSVGVLAFAVFNKGRTLMDNGCNLNTFRKNAAELKTLPVNTLRSIPEDFREYVKMCLNYTPDLRPDATQFSKISYFDNVALKAIKYLESLCQLDNLQKSQFYKGLPNVLSTIPKRIQLQKVLPYLTAEFSNVDMVPFLLPNIFIITENATNEEFAKNILPALTPVFKIRRPVHVMLILLQRMELLLSKTPPEAVRQTLLPLIYGAVESDAVNVQELCLSIIPSIGSLVSPQEMKSNLLPKLMKLVAEASTVSVKVNTLLCISKLIESLEKWMVTDQILPTLPKVNSKEPGVLMAILGIYKMAFNSPKLGISKDQCARNALPFLVSMCVENTLNLNQFECYMAVIKSMLDKVEKEQREKLEQLSAMQEQERSGVDFNGLLSNNQSSSIKKSEIHDVFQELGESQKTGVQRNGSAAPGQTKPGSKSLTLEEKQRLAREQEMTLRMRSQQPLSPNTGTSSNQLPSSKTSPRPLTTANSSKAKDLTDTLLQSSASNMMLPNQNRIQPQNPLQFQAPRYGSQQPAFAQNNTFAAPPFGASAPSGNFSGSFGPMVGAQPGMVGGFGGPVMTPYVGQAPSQQPQFGNMCGAPLRPQAKVDLSAFDGLVALPSKQQKPAMKSSQEPSKGSDTFDLLS